MPALLAIGGFVLNQQAAQRQDSLNQQRREQDQQLAEKKAQQDRQLADDKAKQDTLVKYLDQMADSLKNGLLAAKPGSDKFIVAQSRTVIALQSLDKKRQHLIIQFLQASGLNQVSDKTKPDENGKVTLRQGDRVLLYQAQMSKANLANSDLSGGILIGANLEGANLGCIPPDSRDSSQCSDLIGADLTSADLTSADLSGAYLSYAYLSYAHLFGADLSGADLINADLSYANLSGANLSYANLSGANLTSANLTSANLSYAVLLSVDLRQAKGLTQQQLEGEIHH